MKLMLKLGAGGYISEVRVMSRARCCDRCGKFYTKIKTKKSINGHYIEGIRMIYGISLSDPYDLCSDCVDDLYEFLNIKEETDAQM